MIVRWHGHSFFEIVARNGKRVLIDPFLAPSRRPASAYPADIILVTHAHNDHAGDALKFGAPILSTHEIANELERRGGATTGMGIGGFWRWEGLRFWCAPALHSSDFDDGPDGEPAIAGGHPCGFVVDDGETRLYHAGDTGIFGDMRTVIRDLLQPHVACLPIGDRYTMGPEHAARAVEWLGVNTAVPMHYGTFAALTGEPTEFVKRVGTTARVVVPPMHGGFEQNGARFVRDLSPE